MTRITRGETSHARHKKVLKLAKGYQGRSRNNYRLALERVEKGLQYAYRDRRTKKRSFRNLWIQRINAGAREHGMTYSTFIKGLAKSGININRKILSDLVIREPEIFKKLIKQAQDILAKTV